MVFRIWFSLNQGSWYKPPLVFDRLSDVEHGVWMLRSTNAIRNGVLDWKESVSGRSGISPICCDVLQRWNLIWAQVSTTQMQMRATDRSKRDSPHTKACSKRGCTFGYRPICQINLKLWGSPDALPKENPQRFENDLILKELDVRHIKGCMVFPGTFDIAWARFQKNLVA
jgi:hypothetical protein